MSFAPIFKSPLCDLEELAFPNYRVNGDDPFCSNIQIKFLDCIEAYGIHKGRLKCAELFYDLIECSHETIQKKRVEAISKQRKKEYKAQKLETLYAENPPLDAFVTK